MYTTHVAGRNASDARLIRLGPLLLVVWALGTAGAGAACLPNPDPVIKGLQTLVNQDAHAALTQSQSLLDTETAGPHPQAQRLAALYDVQAQAFSILELESDARDAVSKGLRYATGDTDPVRLDLLATLAENVYDEAGMTAADQLIDKAHALQQPGSLADTCLLIGRGLLQSREGREDLAIGSLTQAYHASGGPASKEPRILAAGTLSSVLRDMGDYTQALALNQEALDWDSAQGGPLVISLDRFLRGRILMLMGNYAEALDEFAASRRYSALANDVEGVAFDDVRMCEARIELGQLDRAAPACESAMPIFMASHDLNEAKETQALLARIDLKTGHAERALKTLNGVLDKGGADLLPVKVGGLYEWRARTNAALHNYREAYSDLAESSRRYVASNDAARTRQASALRAQFETDREIERNAQLKRELDLSQEQAKRQAQQLRWNAVASVSGVLVIALLIYFLLTNFRYRQQLIRLASQDGLTGLPNRRRTAELAKQALREATTENRLLTLAIIDMDHFKIINDRCGHATGDYVLKEFARTSRESLRAEDVLGRWGGEEFLLVMPEASMEVALATLERLRTRVFGIHLPPSGVGLRVSLSAGVAMNTPNIRTLDELIARADAALYQAKNDGRDLVRVADESFVSSSGIRRVAR